MKLSVMITFVLIISAVFFMFALMVNEGKIDNPDANPNITEWENQYNYVNDVNDTVAPLIDKLQKVSDPEQGWFVRIVSGIAAVPYFILLVPQVMFGAFIYESQIIISFLGVFAIPAFIVGIVLISLILFIVFKLVEFFQRQPF